MAGRLPPRWRFGHPPGPCGDAARSAGTTLHQSGDRCRPDQAGHHRRRIPVVGDLGGDRGGVFRIIRHRGTAQRGGKLREGLAHPSLAPPGREVTPNALPHTQACPRSFRLASARLVRKIDPWAGPPSEGFVGQGVRRHRRSAPRLPGHSIAPRQDPALELQRGIGRAPQVGRAPPPPTTRRRTAVPCPEARSGPVRGRTGGSRHPGRFPAWGGRICGLCRDVRPGWVRQERFAQRHREHRLSFGETSCRGGSRRPPRASWMESAVRRAV